MNTLRSEYSNFFYVDSKKEKFGDFVRRVRSQHNLSTTDVERNSGKKISASYVTRIENEPNLNPTLDKILALAKGLGISEHQILAALGIDPLNNAGKSLDEFYGFFNDFGDLDEDDKEELKPTLVMLANDIRRRLANKRKDKK